MAGKKKLTKTKPNRDKKNLHYSQLWFDPLTFSRSDVGLLVRLSVSCHMTQFGRGGGASAWHIITPPPPCLTVVPEALRTFGPFQTSRTGPGFF